MTDVLANQFELADLNIPELEVVLIEKCGILPPAFFTPPLAGPTTFGQLVERSHLDAILLSRRLLAVAEHCRNIRFTGHAKKLRDLNASPDQLVLICDIEEDPRALRAFAGALSTAHQDWTSIYEAIESASEILCLCADGRRSFSTALGLRETYHKDAKYLEGGYESIIQK